ncbi:hypothetical protein H4582DRAFT_2065660 [Lactarius indigo]|nr:hypothetical protein H4582DRAFT_2065660 [Lactarius indigo]
MLSIPFRSPSLRRRPLTTLGHPPPTAVAESQRGEPRSCAFGTGARVAESISLWLVLLPLVSVGEEEGGAGMEWRACRLSSPGRGATLHILSLSVVVVELPLQTVLVSGLEAPGTAVPCLFLRRRPLTTLGRPPPTVIRRVAGGVDITGAGPAASSGQPLVLASLLTVSVGEEEGGAGQGRSTFASNIYCASWHVCTSIFNLQNMAQDYETLLPVVLRILDDRIRLEHLRIPVKTLATVIVSLVCDLRCVTGTEATNGNGLDAADIPSSIDVSLHCICATITKGSSRTEDSDANFAIATGFM